MSDDDVRAFVAEVKQKLRITKVTATRSFKTRSGDYFAGFGAAWDSVQDDAGGDTLVSDQEVLSNAMSLQEARVSYFVLAHEADKAAYQAARANGSLSNEALADALNALKKNYSLLIQNALSSDER